MDDTVSAISMGSVSIPYLYPCLKHTRGYTCMVSVSCGALLHYPAYGVA